MKAAAPPGLRRVALIGNPNTGKTSLFNALTGLRQRVANYPGVTVEMKTGALAPGLEALDLPGAYSLAAHSPDEAVAVQALLGRGPDGPPDLVVVILDASNLHRNLYLATQVLELGVPVILALNMLDVAEQHGLRVDVAHLSRALGAPVIPTCASRGEGAEALRAAINAGLDAAAPRPAWRWPEPLARELHGLAERFPEPEAFLARALIDEGGAAEAELAAAHGESLREALTAARARVRAQGLPPAALEARMRYAWIEETLKECQQTRAVPPTLTERLDAVLAHRVLGSLIFVAAMALIFVALFEGARPAMMWIGRIFEVLARGLAGLFAGTALAGGALESLLIHGVLAGVGGVIQFLPQIVLLFFFLALLEDCGYLARASFLLDRLLRGCGLSGQSFIPLLSSFACGVPGILGARVIGDRRVRLLTVLIAPLMTCSARLVVYTFLVAAFVPPVRVWGVLPLPGLVLTALYFGGVAVAALVALVLRRTLLRGPAAPFVLELPSYKRPGVRTVALRMYDGAWAFVTRAGTVILAVSILVWGLSYFPRPAEVGQHYATLREEAAQQSQGEELAQRLKTLEDEEAGAYLSASAFGRLGRWIEPAVRPLGWDWRIALAVLASVPAREVVIASLRITCDMGTAPPDEGDDGQALAAHMRAATWPDGRPLFSLPAVLSLLAFFALCCQCAATWAALHHETHSWRWPAFAVGYMTVLAYLAALVTYQAATAILR